MPTMSPDEFADSIIQDETIRLRGTTAAASRVNPDQQAEHNRVAKTLNMPPIAVEGWEADAKAQAQAVQIDEATQNTPVLRQKFTDDAFARLAHDDSKPLVTLEDVLTKSKNLGKSVRAALPAASAGIVGGIEAAADISEYLFPSAMLPDFVTNERKAMQKGIKDYRKYLEASAAQVRPVGAPGLEAGVYSGVESFTRNVVNLPLLLMPGGQEAYLASMITPVAGAAYTQSKDQGLNVPQSLAFAGLQSGTEYITERLPALDLLKNLKAGAPALKTFLDNMVQEQVGEQIATAVQDFNEWAILPENKDKPFWDYLKARPNAALETAVATAIGSGGQVAVATTANAVLQRMQGRQQDAQDANATAQALDRVAEFAQASKLRDRSPETFKDYVREVSQDGPVQDVYVSGEVLNQVLEAQGVTRQDLETASPSIAEQLATAVATGGDVRIPVEDFATHLSAPELYQGLADHLKTEPEGMTRTEANEYLQANVETMKAEFDKALASKQGDEAFKASTSKVETDILASLETAGRFTPDVNQQYATLASKVLAVQAARIGITPEEMHARYPVSFAARGGMVGGAMFDQAGNVQTDSPAFKAFYGASVLKDEGGTPQVLYHGTKDTVTAFDLDHPNRKDAGWLGTGVYMTNDPKLAKMYAKMKKGGYEDGKVMELYARLENPYMATMEDKQRLRGLGREGADAFTEELKAQGHDGAILTYPDGTQEVVVFDPAAVKSKQNSGTWSRETANIYEQRGKEQVEGKVVPETIDAVANVEDAFAFASSQKFKTNRDFKLAIQNRVLEAADAAGVDLSDFTQAVEQYLVRIATVDARTALQTNPNAVGWYNDRVTKALRIISLLHPEVATDPKAKFAFTWGLAVTSNGLKVDKNFELAEQVYRRFTETGQMPTDIQAGQAQIAINEGLALYNDLVAKYGIDNVIDFMTTRHTVKEVMEYGGKNISGENLTTEVYGAAVLGPKIGNGFFANLYGHFEQLTVDRWFMRTWGRWTGTLVAENKANVKLKQTQLKAMIRAMSAADKRAFEAIIKIKLDVAKLDEVALAINKASTKPENRKLMGLIGKADDAALAKFDTIFGAATKGTQRASYGDELRKVGNALAKYLDGQKEMPSGPPERARIRKVMNQALETLRQEHPDLTMSDLQALLWYPEKRLYDSAKTSEEATTGYEDDEAPDYANSAAALVAEKGVSREDIDAAIKEVDDELRTQAAERARGAGRGAGDGSLRQDVIGAAAPAGAAAERDRLAQEARGTYNPTTQQISLNKNADLSTALHELGHFHLEVLADLASKPDAPAEIVADMDTVLSWFGEDMTLDSWGAMSLDDKRPYHEKFARGFEAYLFEGKAPTEELRGIFQRFRSWLLAVYRDISKLNVELSDEVRSVFDRLVASNEEIVAAQEARAYAPMFDTKPPFMSDEDWIAYQRADPMATQDAIDTLQTRSLRDMRWLANAKARALRELQAASRDARKAVKAEVTAEVMVEKVNVARTFLKTGLDQDGEKVEGPHKLDRSAVIAMYADMPAELVDLSALGKGRYGMMADNGLHPDIAAEALGYGSGSELVEDLLNAEDPTEKINGMTDQRMLERYGDLTDADAMSRAADEAVHNEARLRFVATELSALEKATGGRKLMASAARGFAKEMVSRLLLRNLRPAQYTAAETRAARAADKALKAGDLVAAATQKRNQLINAHSARAVYKAKAEVEKGMNLFKRIVSAKDEALSRNRNMDLVNASRAILAVYGIGRAKNTPAAYMEKIARYDPVLYADLKLFVDAATQDVPKSGDIRDISLEQFIGLRDTINQLWTMSKRVKEIEIDGKREALADVTATLKDELLVKGVGKFAGMGTQRAVTEGEKKLIGFLGAVALLRRVEEWSKMQGASFERYIYGLVQTSAEKYRAAKIDILPRYRAMLSEIETDLKPFKIYSPELGYTFGEGNGGIGLAELLGAMRHTGNESNLTKLLVGRGWGQFLEDGSLDTRMWDAFINRMMDDGMLKARHFDFLQAEWDLHEEIKPLAQKAHHEVYGRYFNEVTANPISNRFGSYRGGYVAASPDTLLVSEAAQRADAEAMFGGGSALFPAPASGFTKGRIENYTVPLALDLRLAPQQIDKVLRFAYLASPIRDVLRILKDRGFAPVLASYDPVAITDLLMPWLERSASQSVSAPARGQGGKAVDAFARAVRSRTSAALLFANLSNTVQNVTGLAPAALRAGKGNIVRSMWAYLRDPMGSAEAVDSASLMMRNRADTQLDDMRQVLEEIVLNPNAYEKVQTFFSRHAQFMQIGLQNVLDRVVWMAAYDKAVADNEQDPVRFADSVVRTTMGSFTPEDATRFESGPTWARPLTLFAGYFIGQANLLGTEFAKANAAKKWGRGLEVYALGVAIPAIAAQVIAMAFRGDSGDGDDDGLDMGDIFKIFFGSQFGYMAAMVPVVGPVVNSALNRFNDKPYDDKISLSPVASMVEAAAGVPKDLHDLFTDKANWSRTIKDVATAATLATGIPFTLAAKPISYVAGVAEGRIEPTGPVDVARGLVTGVASPESKQP